MNFHALIPVLHECLALQEQGIIQNFAHEHTAVHYEGTLATALLHYTALGYVIRHCDKTTLWAQKGNDRLELIPKTVPEHVAIAIGTMEEFIALDDCLSVASVFSKEAIQTKEEFAHSLFRHKVTNEVIQIIWRKLPRYDGVFG